MIVLVVNKTPEVIIHRRQSPLSEHMLAFQGAGHLQMLTDVLTLKLCEI